MEAWTRSGQTGSRETEGPFLTLLRIRITDIRSMQRFAQVLERCNNPYARDKKPDFPPSPHTCPYYFLALEE